MKILYVSTVFILMFFSFSFGLNSGYFLCEKKMIPHQISDNNYVIRQIEEGSDIKDLILRMHEDNKLSIMIHYKMLNSNNYYSLELFYMILKDQIAEWASSEYFNPLMHSNVMKLNAYDNGALPDEIVNFYVKKNKVNMLNDSGED